eukprot:1679481-Pleurochrysis_carterae.AAC.1
MSGAMKARANFLQMAFELLERSGWSSHARVRSTFSSGTYAPEHTNARAKRAGTSCASVSLLSSLRIRAIIPV